MTPHRKDDPETFFREVAATHARCFWLDGGGAREWSGRRSLIGWLEDDDVSLSYDAARRLVTRHANGVDDVVGDDVFAVLEAELAAGSASDQWFGCFGYASRADLPASSGRRATDLSADLSADLPDALWMRAGQVRLFDHSSSGESGLPQGALGDSRRRTAPPAGYARAFDHVREQLHAGNSYEVNLTYRQQLRSGLDPVGAYLRLRALNPAPYAGFLQHDLPGARAWLLSSSPERYALVSADRTLETKPIKGTVPRGATVEQDAELKRWLAHDPKSRAENLMIVDLLRNDFSMVCDPGTVEVPVLMEVESYANVHQLVSTVRGRLTDGVTTIGALRALFPAGSMTGAPKRRTMQIIEAVEESPRGLYAGAFGWIAGDGRADLGVVIRSLMTAGDGTYVLGTGGGITVLSDLEAEYDECAVKADRLLAVFDAQPGTDSD